MNRLLFEQKVSKFNSNKIISLMEKGDVKEEKEFFIFVLNEKGETIFQLNGLIKQCEDNKPIIFVSHQCYMTKLHLCFILNYALININSKYDSKAIEYVLENIDKMFFNSNDMPKITFLIPNQLALDFQKHHLTKQTIEHLNFICKDMNFYDSKLPDYCGYKAIEY